MPFELLRFRGSDQIIKEKGMEEDVINTLEYLDHVLYGSLNKKGLIKQALQEMHWRDSEDLAILEGRRYQYKGLKNRIAIEGDFSAYEYILTGLFRLQIGFDREKIDTGILFLNGYRGEKTPYGSTMDLAHEEVESLYPTISMPVSIAIFDLGSLDLFFEQEEVLKVNNH